MQIFNQNGRETKKEQNEQRIVQERARLINWYTMQYMWWQKFA